MADYTAPPSVSDTMDPIEFQRLSRIGTAFQKAKHDVKNGQVEPYIEEHLCDEFLAELRKNYDLPAIANLELCAIAQFLHDNHSANWPKPSDVKTELKKLRKSALSLRMQLEKLSPTAEVAMTCFFDNAFTAEGGELVPAPIEQTIEVTNELVSWIDLADVPEGRAGKHRTAKFYAIWLLRRLLETRRSGCNARDLEAVSQEVLGPVFDQIRDSKNADEPVNLKDMIPDVMKFIPQTPRTESGSKS